MRRPNRRSSWRSRGSSPSSSWPPTLASTSSRYGRCGPLGRRMRRNSPSPSSCSSSLRSCSCGTNETEFGVRSGSPQGLSQCRFRGTPFLRAFQGQRVRPRVHGVRPRDDALAVGRRRGGRDPRPERPRAHQPIRSRLARDPPDPQARRTDQDRGRLQEHLRPVPPFPLEQGEHPLPHERLRDESLARPRVPARRRPSFPAHPERVPLVARPGLPRNHPATDSRHETPHVVHSRKDVKIVTLVSGDARYDGRVLRATRSLRAAGHDVQVFDQGRYTPSAISRGAFLVRATRRALRFKPDVVHANDLDTLPAGIALKRLVGSRLVYDCHEFYFDMVRDRHREAVSRAFGVAEPILADEADAIIAANEGVRDYLETFLDQHVTVVHNYPNAPNGWKAPFTHKPFTLIYIGTFQRGRFLEEATHVVRRRTDIRMTIWGAKADLSRLEGGPVIAVRGMVDNERVVPLMAGAHAVLAMYDPSRMQNARGMRS